MDLRQDVARLVVVAHELGDLDEVVGLGAGLLQGIVDEDGVGLAPPPAARVGWVGAGDLGGAPQGREALIALHAPVVVGRREAELVAAPDGDDALVLLGRHQLGAHAADVVGLRRRPDDDGEGLDAVGQEAARVGPLHELRRVLPARPVQQRPVQVDHHQDLARVRQEQRRQRRVHQVRRRRVGHAARRRRRLRPLVLGRELWALSPPGRAIGSEARVSNNAVLDFGLGWSKGNLRRR